MQAHPDLRTVKESLLQAAALSKNKYLSFAEIGRDHQKQKPASATGRVKSSVEEHQFGVGANDDLTFAIDSPLELVQADVHSHSHDAMAFDQWQRITKDDQVTWDLLSPKAKTIVLGRDAVYSS